MNVDERGRAAAVALLTRANDGVDVDSHLQELHARADTTSTTARPRGRLVAATVAFAVVALIVGAVVAVAVSVSGSDTSGPTTNVAPRDVVGYVATSGLPRGFRATAMEKVDQSAQPGGTNFRTVVYLEHPARGGHAVEVLVSRNPFNGVLKDEPPDAGRTVRDPFTGGTALAWTRAPYWEIQVSGDVPIGELMRVANGVSVPDDVNAGVDAAALPPPPAGYDTLYDASNTTGITRIRAITYSRAYGSRPSVTISSESPGDTLRNFTRLQVVRVRGGDAILHTGRDQFGNRIYILLFHESRDRETTVTTTGLARAQLFAIAEHMRPVNDAGWAKVARGVRPLDSFVFPALGPAELNRGVTIASYQTAEGPLDAVLDTFTVDGFRWTCLKVREGDGSFTNQCTDPETGFAFPTQIGATVTGATRFVDVVIGSFGRKVASVRVTQGTQSVPVTIYDTHTGSAPKLFVAFVAPDATPSRVIALDARGHVVQRATVGPGGALVLNRG